MSFAGAASLAPRPPDAVSVFCAGAPFLQRAPNSSNYDHDWDLAGLQCLRCKVTLRGHVFRSLQETGQLRRSARPFLRAREMSDADIRSILGVRDHLHRPVVAPPGPVRTVASILPHLMLAWGLIWMRWALPPKEEL